MRLPQRHAKLIVPAGAPTIYKMIPFVDTQNAPPLLAQVPGASHTLLASEPNIGWILGRHLFDSS